MSSAEYIVQFNRFANGVVTLTPSLREGFLVGMPHLERNFHDFNLFKQLFLAKTIDKLNQGVWRDH